MELPPCEKEKRLLAWAVGADNANKFMITGDKIPVDMINPIYISKNLFSDNVCLRTMLFVCGRGMDETRSDGQ